jgi:hypothetical protein
MWLYPLPGIISIFGWVYVLGTSQLKPLIFALAIFLVGSAAYFIRAWGRKEWPFRNRRWFEKNA